MNGRLPLWADDAAVRSLVQLYGPLAAALVVGILGLIGILVKSARDAEQKRLELRVAEISGRIEALAEMASLATTYALRLGELSRLREAMKKCTEDEEVRRYDATVVQRFDASFDVLTRILHLAHSFGYLYDHEGYAHTLSPLVHRWWTLLRAIDSEQYAVPIRSGLWQNAAVDLGNYLEFLIDFLSQRRARLLCEPYHYPPSEEPPEFDPETWPYKSLYPPKLDAAVEPEAGAEAPIEDSNEASGGPALSAKA